MTADDDGTSRTLKARVREFVIPPIQDGLVVGREAAIGSAALCRAIRLLVTSPFELVEVEDDVIGHLLVRSAILRRVPRAALVGFAVRKVKPLMGAEEILHLQIDAELSLEERGW